MGKICFSFVYDVRQCGNIICIHLQPWFMLRKSKVSFSEFTVWTNANLIFVCTFLTHVSSVPNSLFPYDFRSPALLVVLCCSFFTNEEMVLHVSHLTNGQFGNMALGVSLWVSQHGGGGGDWWCWIYSRLWVALHYASLVCFSLSLPPLTCFPSPLVGFPGCAQNALETSQTEFVEREIETEKQVTTLENAGRQLKVSAGKSSLVSREDH